VSAFARPAQPIERQAGLPPVAARASSAGVSDTGTTLQLEPLMNHLTPQEEGHLRAALAESERRLASVLLSRSPVPGADPNVLRDRIERLRKELSGEANGSR
jgi:hypothetical protein